MANIWQTTTEGTLSSPKLSSEFRLQASPQMVFEQHAVLKKEALGKNAGDTVTWTKTLTLPDEEGAPVPLSEEHDVPSGEVKQVPCTGKVYEYGKQIPWSSKLADLSAFDIRDSRQKVLLDHQIKTLERLAFYEIIKAKFTAVITGVTKADVAFRTDGTVTGTGTTFLKKETLQAIRDYAETKLIPPCGGPRGTYKLIAGIPDCSSLESDMLAILMYTKPEQVLNGEIGMVANTRVMKDNMLLGNLVTSQYRGIFFGDDALTGLTAVSPHLEYDPGRFNRQRALAWLTITGYQKTWDLVADDANAVGAANLRGIERIIRIGSV